MLSGLDITKRAVNQFLGLLGYELHKKSKPWYEPIGLEGLIPPRRLWVGSADPLYWFFGYPWEYRAYLTLLCETSKNARVLELGCNHGRTMLTLLDYLEPPGRYDGLDILPAQIKFAQENIQSAFPHFHFHLADVYNRAYYPQGKQRADTYRFPFEDSFFDVAYAASLFTHLVPSDAANYLKESRRVLRSRGRCLFSFFLLDYFREPVAVRKIVGMQRERTSMHAVYNFQYPLNGEDRVAIQDPELPERVIAYRISLLEELAAEAGLTIRQIIPGFWSKNHAVGVNEQDLVLFECT